MCGASLSVYITFPEFHTHKRPDGGVGGGCRKKLLQDSGEEGGQKNPRARAKSCCLPVAKSIINSRQ